MTKTQEQKKTTGDLVHTIEKLRKMTDGLSEVQLRVRPEEKKWSIKEIVAHLAAFEPIALSRFKAMMTTDNPQIQLYDTDAWAAADHIEEDFDGNLQKFITARKKTTDLLKKLREKEWLRPGRHPEVQSYTIQVAAERLAAHDANHLKQVDAIRKRFAF